MGKILKRILTKSGYKYLIILAALDWATYYLWINDPAYAVKHRKNLELVCQFQDGVRIVPKYRIITYDDEKNFWVFTNGWTRNCSIVDKRTGNKIDFGH